MKGWDVLRQERFERQKKLGLVRPDATLPPRSEVPVDRDDIANGFSGKPNPKWSDLPSVRREDLARRMATFAAMVEHIDLGVGRVIADLEKNGELDNTLIAFLSDNGACYEWGPFGFDGRSRKGTTTLYSGEKLADVGQPGTHTSYGSGWANLGNTPLNMYKHFCHEGGIASPLILHWPDGIQPTKGYVKIPSHLMDIVPTVLAATGAQYPVKRSGNKITPFEGINLLPALSDDSAIPERPLAFEHQGARGLRKGHWKLVWGKRQPDKVTWELYNLAQDRSEQNNVAANYTAKKEELLTDWTTWAKRVGADPYIIPEPGYQEPLKSPQIANRSLAITATVEGKNLHGVVLAQGGKQHGYALHFINGVPSFDIRINGKVTRLSAAERHTGSINLQAKITKNKLALMVNGKTFEKPSPGLITVQPTDSLSLGRDTKTAAGNYEAPNPFNGKILTYEITQLESAAISKKPKVWIYTDMSDKTLAGNDHKSINDPDDISAMAGYLLLANEFETLNIVVASTHRPQHRTTPDQAKWATEYLGTAYQSALSGLQKNIGDYPKKITFTQSCIKETSERFNPKKDYRDLTNYSTVTGLLEAAQDSPDTINVLSWGSLTEPAILVKHCLTTGKEDALKKLRFIAHWTNSTLHQGTPEHPERVANCREDAKACAFLKSLAAKQKIIYHECGAIGQHGIVSGSPKGEKYFEQFKVSPLGKIFAEGKFAYNSVDHSDSATYWALLGKYGVSLTDIPSNGTNPTAIEKKNEDAFKKLSRKIHDELLRRARAAQ